MFKIIHLKEFFPYFIIGGLATCIDWTLFWLSTHVFMLHYITALTMGYVIAGLFHYTCNKFITFQCHSKQVGTQYSMHFLVSGASLGMSMVILATLINLFMMNKMVARIVTTAIMLIPNYLMHKYITFNKKYFFKSTPQKTNF